MELAIHLDALEALFAQLGEFLAVFAFPVADDRGQQIGARPLLHRHDAINHFGDLLRLDRLTGRRGIGRADPREEKPHIVVNLRHRADGGAGIAARRLLFDGDRRRETFDMVDIRFLHHLQELPGVGRQALHIPSLAFGIDRIEGEGRLAGTGKPGDHAQLVPGQIDVDALQVVLPRAADGEVFLFGHFRSRRHRSDWRGPAKAQSLRHPVSKRRRTPLGRSSRRRQWCRRRIRQTASADRCSCQ